ncbi:hypothetical protein Tsubulata_026012 [Turnera subulata]|uniref:Pectinesterase inhibitor domain-containing protein n=1 Tax=Turnera subulata TaxID=218843 RepID=A0A9Q0FXQ0_9ROSI|nr:hypothetical protein Tsubulata_026012 [Turnera subulata]
MPSLHHSQRNFVVFIVFMLLFIHSAHGIDPTQEWIDKICFQTLNYGFCSKTFEDNLKSPSTDILGLTELAIELVLKNATNTFTYTWTILNNATTSPKVKPVLAGCVKDYQTILKDFLLASKDFTRKRYKKMVARESAAVKPIDKCESGFSHKSSFSFLAERNEQLRILISMSVIAGGYVAY